MVGSHLTKPALTHLPKKPVDLINILYLGVQCLILLNLSQNLLHSQDSHRPNLDLILARVFKLRLCVDDSKSGAKDG